MRFNLKFSVAALVTASCISSSALAVTKDISLTTMIDPSVSIIQANGTDLPPDVKMSFTPGKGLTPVSIPTKFITTGSKGVNVSLVTAAVLTDANSLVNTIPLNVKLAGKPVGTTATAITTAELAVDGVTKESTQLNLTIEQATQSGSVAAGHYTGTVSLIIANVP